MQDRYLFRGKRTDNGEWVQGFLSVHTFIPSEEEFEKSGKETYLAPVIESVPERIYDHDVYEVDPSTICQCTGLKDKNGKLIWENDIIKTQYGKAVVVWDKSEGRIKWLDDLIWRKELNYWASDNSWRIEVIGNKFDNPELFI